MNILILGASSKNSIGFTVGETLGSQGHSVHYASRSGKLGFRCDITKPKGVRTLMVKARPDVVILAAGVFSRPKNIGAISLSQQISNHVRAKSFGALVVSNELARVNEKGTLIVLGGREVSSHKGFAQFTVGNGALWSLVRFLNTHTQLNAYYLDLPFVANSAMHKNYVRATNHGVAGEITFEKVAQVITRIITRPPKRERIVLGKESV